MTTQAPAKVNALITTLDSELSIDDLRALERMDLYRLRELLHHWEQVADQIHRDERALSREEESE